MAPGYELLRVQSVLRLGVRARQAMRKSSLHSRLNPVEVFGNVVAILDETKLLIRLDTYFAPGAELTVFAAIERPELKDLGLEELLIPKGRITVSLQQNESLYLASRFQEVSDAAKGVTMSVFEFALAGKSNWSAAFDKSQSLGIEYPREIRVGDRVGRK